MLQPHTTKSLVTACLCAMGLAWAVSCAPPRVSPDLSRTSASYHASRDADLDRFCTDLYIKAVSDFTLARYEHAVELLHRLNSLRPSSETHLLAAKCYQSMARTDSALAYVRTAVALNDSCEECWTLLGDLLLSKTMWCESAAAFRSAVRLHDVPGNRYRYATALSECDPLAAISELETLFDESQNYALLFELSSLYERIGDSTREYQTVERIITDMPADGFPLESYVDVLLKGYQYETVLNIMESSGVRRNTDQIARILRQMATAMYSDPTVCDSTQVRKLYSMVCRVVPRDVDMMEVCGLLLHGKGLRSDAREAFVRALDGDSSIGSIFRVTSYGYEQGDTSIVWTSMTHNEAKARASYEVSLLCGMMFEWCDSAEKAIRWYRHAASLNDTTVEAWMYLAGLYGKTGKKALADRTYEDIIARDPSNGLALNNVAYSYACQGRQLKKAVQYARRALEISPDKPSYLDTYAWVLHKSGRYAEADSVLSRAIGIMENNATFFEHLGDNSQKLGLRDRAFAAWNRALELDSSRTYLQDRLKSRK